MTERCVNTCREERAVLPAWARQDNSLWMGCKGPHWHVTMYRVARRCRPSSLEVEREAKWGVHDETEQGGEHVPRGASQDVESVLSDGGTRSGPRAVRCMPMRVECRVC